MSNKKETGEHLSIKRLAANVKFILQYVWEQDAKVILCIYATFMFSAVVVAIYDTLFLKYFIEMIQNRDIKIPQLLAFILIGSLILRAAYGMEIWVENWAQVRFLKINGNLQRKFIEKAAQIDLICYDNPDYFNDFVIAASQSEEMMASGILSTAAILGQTLGIFTLGTLIMTINPVIACFPIAGFVVNMITRFKITEYEYNYEMEYKKIMRKADYSKRVFYQPEYAKEIKLSDIRIPLTLQFNEAVGEITGKAHTIGIKIAILSLINWICTFTLFSFFAVPAYLGYLALVKHSIALGEVAAMNNAQMGVRNHLDGLNYALVRFQKVGQFAERFRRFIDYEIQIEDKVDGVSMPSTRQPLVIKDMSFRYEGAKKDTLKHINMTIKPGEKVAFVGENGAGKTTFVKLLMRLYDVTGGSICYGDRDIRDYGIKNYRDCIGAVFQDYQIYGASLGENVLMDLVGKDDEKKIKTALNKADFAGKLAKLEKGVDTELTREFYEDGTMLSGGEAQKVAISRMFAKTEKLSIAILDEPSSALDPLAEYKLNQSMIDNAGDATIIFISHRLSTTKDADRIYMFAHGEIIEEGTHEELMEKKGEYATMFEKQAHYYQDIVA